MRVRGIFLISIFMVSLFTTLALGEDCKKAVELYNKGTLSQNFEEKERLFKEALTLSCKDRNILGKIHNNLADTYEKQGRIKEAIAEYKRAIELDKRLATPYLSLGDIYFKKGIFEYAIEYYEKGLDLKDDNLARANLEKARKKIPLYKSKKEILASLSLESTKRNIRPVPSVNLYFGFDKAEITKRGERQLNALLDALNEKELICCRFRLSGHTCDIGTEEYNQKLSVRRAKAVRDWLVEHGISKDRLEIIGYGERMPLDPRKTEEARRLNRRVEIRTVGLTIDLKRATGKLPAKGIRLFNEGERLLKESRFSEASAKFENALKIFKENNFKDGIRSAIGNLYLVYIELNNNEKALSYLKQFQKMAK